MEDKFKGRAKEAAGAFTGDEEKKAEGQAQQRKGQASKEAAQRAKTRQTEKEAKDVLGQLKKGEDFAKIAETKSTDKATSVRGGDLGYFTASGVVKEFSNAAFAMKIGEVSSAPVKSQFGWHVIKIVDRRKQTPPTYEQQKDQIRAALAEEQVQKLVAELRKSAKVELFNADGSPAQAPAQ